MEITVYVEIPVTIELEPSAASRGRGEMLRMAGRLVEGPALEPDEPAELNITEIAPGGDFETFNDQIEAKVGKIDESEIWGIVDEIKQQEECDERLY